MFVNNVSLGLYAEAVQREGYRDAKLRTLLDTVPECSAPAGASSTCAGPARAGTNTTRVPRCSCPTTATGSAARSARAHGRGSTTACSASRSSAPLGAARAAALQRPWREWSARLRGGLGPPSPAGIDGEASARPPAALRIRPGACTCGSREHPGASPSAKLPEGSGPALVGLVRIAAGAAPQPQPHPKEPANGPDGDHREAAPQP